jgi:hypothetical protein
MRSEWRVLADTLLQLLIEPELKQPLEDTWRLRGASLVLQRRSGQWLRLSACRSFSSQA